MAPSSSLSLPSEQLTSRSSLPSQVRVSEPGSEAHVEPRTWLQSKSPTRSSPVSGSCSQMMARSPSQREPASAQSSDSYTHSTQEMPLRVPSWQVPPSIASQSNENSCQTRSP